MQDRKTVTVWMDELGIGLDALVAASLLEPKIVEAIIHGRYTPSPQQRRCIAVALSVDPEAITWGHTAEVQHIQGHGPQFGRSP